jgi:hypothetical protein
MIVNTLVTRHFDESAHVRAFYGGGERNRDAEVCRRLLLRLRAVKNNDRAPEASNANSVERYPAIIGLALNVLHLNVPRLRIRSHSCRFP